MDKSRSGPAGATDERPRLGGMRPVNWALLAAGVVAILLGYVQLDRGSVTAAPLLLSAGYFVLIPAGLLVGLRRGGGGMPTPGSRGE
jgi:hypothetical protein